MLKLNAVNILQFTSINIIHHCDKLIWQLSNIMYDSKVLYAYDSSVQYTHDSLSLSTYDSLLWYVYDMCVLTVQYWKDITAQYSFGVVSGWREVLEESCVWSSCGGWNSAVRDLHCSSQWKKDMLAQSIIYPHRFNTTPLQNQHICQTPILNHHIYCTYDIISKQ